MPAYEQVMKASHAFNLLDARHAISVTERQRYILRVRTLSKACAQAYYANVKNSVFHFVKTIQQMATLLRRNHNDHRNTID